MAFFYIRLAIFIIFALPSAIYEKLKLKTPYLLPLAGLIILSGYYLFFFEFKFHPFFKNIIMGAVLLFVLALVLRFLLEGIFNSAHMIFAAFTGLLTGFPLCFVAAGIAAVLLLIYYLCFSFTKKKKSGDAVVIRHQFTVPVMLYLLIGTLVTFGILLLNQ